MDLKTTKKGFINFLILILLAAAGCSKENNPVESPQDTVPGAAYIDLNKTHQVIKGFGGVNMPGWIPDLTADQVQTAFETGTGQIGLSILRIRVPYDETKFNLEVPAAKLAESYGAIVFATPWTPPAQMKSNNNIVGGILNDSSYAAYAAHLKSFSDYMSASGAPLYAVSVQNEPDVSVNYESCDWNASQMLKFVKYNAPSVGNKIIVPESYNFNHVISDAILNDPAAAANVSIVGGHIYGGGLNGYALAAEKGKELWMTEHLDTDTSYAAVLRTGKEIDNCMYFGMNAYVWWYIRRFYGLIGEDGKVTKRGYVMSQYARFIRPGYVRVDATSNPRELVFATAYKYGSKVVIVSINEGAASVSQRYILRGGTVNTVTPYVTSVSKNCKQGENIKVSGNDFVADLDPLSITTFVSE